jgi:D-alanyl-D-alanine carboxypeptidase
MKKIPQHTIDYIDSWLDLRYKWADIPGFTVLVAKDGKVLFDKAYGYSNLETKEMLQPDHLFRIASQSKTFTATAIMQLQEKEKLRIDDHVIDYLPWLERHADRRWQKVTIRQLLSHSAGVIRDGLDSSYWNLQRPFPSAKELHEAILETDLILEPNTKLKYSNYGYALLGEVVERVSGQAYNEYVTEYIIKPLGLKNTYPEITDKIKPRLSNGYTRQNLNKERLCFPHVSTLSMSPATGFCSTAADLSKYLSAHLIGSGELLSNESKREMQRVQWESTKESAQYGLGIDIEKVGSRQLIGHSGGFPGFVTRSYIDPEDAVCVIVLTNCHLSWASSIAQAIYGLIDEFGDEDPKKEYLKYEGRFSGLHGAMDIIAHYSGLRAFASNSWFPLYQVETLEVVNNSTLKMTKSDSFANEGELIKFVFNNDGTIKHIIDSGSVRLPSKDDELIQTWA